MLVRFGAEVARQRAGWAGVDGMGATRRLVTGAGVRVSGSGRRRVHDWIMERWDDGGSGNCG
jgi:hypothetical protein